jgi:hypothetical protein
MGPDQIPAVTTLGTLLNGLDVFEGALRAGEKSIACLEYDLTDAQVLEWIIEASARQTYLKDFNRIVLALDLIDEQLKTAATANQRTRTKEGWTRLSEAQRVHRNEKIAEKAHTGIVNVKKCRFILASKNKELVDALRRDEISINRAYAWLKSKSKNPSQELAIFRLGKEAENSIEAAVNNIAATHSGCDQGQETTIGLPEFIATLPGLESERLQQIEMRVIETDLPVIFISRQLLKFVRDSRAHKGGFNGDDASELVARNSHPRQEVLGFSGPGSHHPE